MSYVAYDPDSATAYTVYTAYEPQLPPLRPPPPDSAFAGEGCSGQGVPPADELKLLRELERLGAARQREIEVCEDLQARYQALTPEQRAPFTTAPSSACVQLAQEKYGAQVVAGQAAVAALCKQKRQAPPPALPTTYALPEPAPQREPETETPEQKQPYVPVAPPAPQARAGVSGSGLLLAAVVIGGVYVGWKLTRRKKS